MWEPLMATLAAEGYRCVAPDQRGYSPGARPEEADAYRYADLAADVLELARGRGAGVSALSSGGARLGSSRRMGGAGRAARSGAELDGAVRPPLPGVRPR